LGGYYNLVPFVYYLFHSPEHQVPNSEIEKVWKAVYLFGFTSPFSRYADSRLGAIIREEFKPLVEKNDTRFPLKGYISWIQYWENIEEYGSQLLQNNPSLVLHLIQRRSGAKVHYDKNAPQIDHIFPQSVLRKKGQRLPQPNARKHRNNPLRFATLNHPKNTRKPTPRKRQTHRQ
jgi:hypothetical protein